jgi:hypothetical protein
MPYERTPSLLSKGERAFWFPLYYAVRGRYRIFCKVRLADVIRCPPNRPDERKWFKRVKGYHVDFVLCDPQSTRPLLVLELDDRSHRSDRAKDRDAFKDAALRAAGVPLFRVNAQQAYAPDELRSVIDSLLRPQPSSPAPPPMPPAPP